MRTMESPSHCLARLAVAAALFLLPRLSAAQPAPHTPTPYVDFVRQVDADVGRTLAALEQHGLARNTITIFTSDSGYAPGSGGWSPPRRTPSPWRKAFQAGAPPKRPVDYVDPRIDTHQTRWIFFASASRPFGMVSLSPDTRLEGDWGAGYIYVEPYIRAFSHIHDWQLAGVPVMPVVGRMNGHEGYEAYKAPFSHER